MTSPEHREGGEPTRGVFGSRLWFWGCLALVAGWLVTLGILALRTANPVTLNRSQLLQSDVVLVGRVVEISQSRVAHVKVESILASRPGVLGDDIPATLHLTRGIEQLEPDRPFLLPLTREALRLEITPAPLAADETWIAYPASPRVIQVAKKILAAQPAQPYP